MQKSEKLPIRKNARLQNYDYSQAGWYYVTIRVESGKCLLGNIENSQVKLSCLGKVVEQSWLWLAKQYDYILLDKYVVMPDHFHGIIQICRGSSRTAREEKIKPIGSLIAAFKTFSTREINQINKTPGIKFWQRNYYEHIIRNNDDLLNARNYILDNPRKRQLDI